MKFHGLLLRESLADESVLDQVTITKTETWNVANATANQPNIWHAMYYEGDADQAQDIAQSLSVALKKGEWYTNFTAGEDVYVIFPQKVFVYSKGDEAKREAAKEYGRSIDLDESQLDWSE